MEPASPQRGWMPLLYALLLASGASGLAFEIVWLRALGLTFGTSVPALTTVLAAFMAGLALGNLFLGRLADRHPRPLRLYAQLELGIGVSGALVSLLLLGAGAPGLLASLQRGAAPLSPVLRALASFLVLLVPATLMGGTLPTVTRALARAGEAGRVAGFVYAANTGGAVLGALLPDLLLVPALGLRQTALLAGTLNLAVALIVIRLEAGLDPPAAPTAPPLAASPITWVPLLLFAASGFCAMGYEVLWSRLLEHFSAGRITGFSLLLAVNLGAVALGSRLTSRRADWSGRPVGSAALLLLLSGSSTFALVALLPRGYAWIAGLLPQDPTRFRAAPSEETLQALLLSTFLVALPCALMGAALPYLAAGAVKAGATGRDTGRLYAINTLAGVAGAGVTGFALLPLLGTQRALAALCALAVVSGAAGASAVAAGPLRRAAPVGLALLACGLGLLVPAGLLRSALYPFSPRELLSVREGTTTSVAVVQRFRFGQPSVRELRTPGVSMSSTGWGARRYMGLMAHLPLLLARGSRDALLICYGVGNTARSLLSHPALERLDVVDISPEVLAASPLFAAVAGSDPLRDPRTHVFVGDGRQHLLVSGRRYDVITAEPPPPSNAGVVNLYSREYYAAARRALQPGGVVAQWLPAFQLTGDELLAITASMTAEFGWVGLFQGAGSQLILLGREEPPGIDLADWELRSAAPPVRSDLRDLGILGVPDLLATLLQGDRGLRAAAASAEPITDDLPSLQYPTRPVVVPVELPAGLIGDGSEVFRLIAGLDAGSPDAAAIAAAVAATQLEVRAVGAQALAPPELRELEYGNALRRALARQPRHPGLLGLLELDDGAVEEARRALALDPGRGDAAFELARRDFYTGEFAAALARLEELRPAAANAAIYWLVRGGCERALARLGPAAVSFERSAAASSSEPFRERALELRAGVAQPIGDAGPLALAARR